MFESRPDRDAEVIFVGRSNVGKSTLMRELTGHTFETGSKPGVTRSPNHYDWASEDFVLTDLPGFGFMSGVSEEQRERIKTDIVRYVEEYADKILVGVLVVDGKSAVDIIDRHSGEDEVPYDVEMFYFLRDVGIPVVVAVNKIDKVDDEDPDQNLVGVVLNVAHDVRLYLLALLLGHAGHEAEPRQVGQHEVLAGPVVVVRRARDAGFAPGLEAVAGNLAHQRGLADVRPADEDYFRIAVRATLEHTRSSPRRGLTGVVLWNRSQGLTRRT